MGGDLAPRMVVEGLDIAVVADPDVRYLLFGDEAKLRPLLERFPRVRQVTDVRHTSEVVTNDEKPGIALRSGRASSMRLAIDAAAAGESEGVVSAGNTGALMAMAKFVFKTLPGIDRPAIAGCFPTQRGSCVMLDLGANVECSDENLVQFAVMGEVFARYVLRVPEPTIGILNIGVEGLKGNDSVRKAAARLQSSNLPIHFHGFVEGDDIGEGTVDVIVTDGFTGNIALKTAEGAAKLVSGYLRRALKRSLLGTIGAVFAAGALGTLKRNLDPRASAGGVFLGLNGIVVKAHGGTDEIGFSGALSLAVDLAHADLNARITADHRKLDGASQEQEQAALT